MIPSVYQFIIYNNCDAIVAVQQAQYNNKEDHKSSKFAHFCIFALCIFTIGLNYTDFKSAPLTHTMASCLLSRQSKKPPWNKRSL